MKGQREAADCLPARDGEHPGAGWPAGPRGVLGVAARRGALLVFVWWALAEGQPAAWGVGLVAIAIAVGTSLALTPRTGARVRPLAMLRFAGHFLGRSLLGGVYVAWRALDPRRPLAPAFLDYPLRLPPGASAIYFANTVSLLPGTLSVTLEARSLRVHVLDVRRDPDRDLDALEERVAALFGISVGQDTASRR